MHPRRRGWTKSHSLGKRWQTKSHLDVQPAPRDSAGTIPQCSQVTLVWDLKPPIHLRVGRSGDVLGSAFQDLGIHTQTFATVTVNLSLGMEFNWFYNTLADQFMLYYAGDFVVGQGDTSCLVSVALSQSSQSSPSTTQSSLSSSSIPTIQSTPPTSQQRAVSSDPPHVQSSQPATSSTRSSLSTVSITASSHQGSVISLTAFTTATVIASTQSLGASPGSSVMPKPRSPSAAVIAGTTVAGVLSLVILGIAVVVCRRRLHRRSLSSYRVSDVATPLMNLSPFRLISPAPSLGAKQPPIHLPPSPSTPDTDLYHTVGSPTHEPEEEDAPPTYRG
ncbi:hypothetical protein HGRIS_014031 [Hohenbuehelia grisea]|uniref:Uncharacterized protein n=1 Tax=Hohenbuehelia grisea TaxID=104357 RepID=A0ABR3JSY6_9AGAR